MTRPSRPVRTRKCRSLNTYATCTWCQWTKGHFQVGPSTSTGGAQHSSTVFRSTPVHDCVVTLIWRLLHNLMTKFMCQEHGRKCLFPSPPYSCVLTGAVSSQWHHQRSQLDSSHPALHPLIVKAWDGETK